VSSYPVLTSRFGRSLVGGLAVSVLVLAAGEAYLGVGGNDSLLRAALVDVVIVMGLQTFVGTTGLLSLGHIGFAAVAGYTTFLLAASPVAKTIALPDAPFGVTDVSVPVWAAVLAGVALVALLALLLAAALSRAPDITATMLTVSFLFVVHALATNWQELTGGTSGLNDPGLRLTSRTWLYVGVVIAVVAARVFKASRPGRLAIASSEDGVATSAMGVSVPWSRTIALVVSAAIVGFGAGLRVLSLGSINAREYYFGFTFLTLTMLIIGGKRSVTGAALGVVIVTAVNELALKAAADNERLGGLPDLVLGAAVIILMVARPKGLLGDWELDDLLPRRRAGARPLERVQSKAVPSPSGDGAGAATITTTDVGVVFGGFRALAKVDLLARSDEVVGLIGPNGAGKTTLVNVITGLVPPSGGRVELDGHELTGWKPHEIARAGLARTFQNLRLFPDLSVRENVEIAVLSAARHRADRPAPDVDALLQLAGLLDRQDARAGQLDYGSQRKLELVRAAALRPAFLILDEPTSGMSDAESSVMIEHVRRTAAAVGAGVLVIDHDLHFITNICDRIYVLDQGEVIAADRPEVVRHDPRVVEAYLGTTTAT
jgi:branched-chain amino acid transport system ATP-binding protein/branched-chain amino acid transport system permease protein